MNENRKQIDVLVRGTHLEQLAVAYECAKVGLKVLILDDESATQRDLFSPVHDPRGVVSEFINDVATPVKETEAQSIFVHKTVPKQARVLVNSEWMEEEPASIFGIPSSPLAAKTIAILGSGGAFRAYLDRVKPLLTIGKTAGLADLVTARVGKKALNKLVEPHIQYAFGYPVEDVETGAALPGLNETMTRAGSLTNAVLAYSDRYLENETKIAPDCGWEEFKSHLLRKIELLGGEIAVAGEEQTDAMEALDTRAVIGASPSALAGTREIIRITLPAENGDFFSVTSWRDTSGADLSAATFHEADSFVLEIRSAVDGSVRQENISEALTKFGREPELADQAAKHRVDTAPVTEEEIRENLVAAEEQLAKITTEEPISVSCQVSNAERSFMVSLSEALKLGLHLRRQLLTLHM